MTYEVLLPKCLPARSSERSTLKRILQSSRAGLLMKTEESLGTVPEQTACRVMAADSSGGERVLLGSWITKILKVILGIFECGLGIRE